MNKKFVRENNPENVTCERLYAMLLRLGDEVRELSAQVRALRKQWEGNEKR